MNLLNIAKKKPYLWLKSTWLGRLSDILIQRLFSPLKQQNQTWALQFKSLQNNNTAKIQPHWTWSARIQGCLSEKFPTSWSCSSVFNPLLYPASSNKLCGHLTEHFLILLLGAESGASSLQIAEIPKPVEIVRNINFIRIIARRWEVSVCKFSSARCLRGCTQSSRMTRRCNRTPGRNAGLVQKPESVFAAFSWGLEEGIGELGD